MKKLVEALDIYGMPITENTKAPVTRSTFLYMEPAKDIADFAQCSSCRMWTGKTCLIHGEMEVSGSATCGLYMNGDPQPDKIGQEEKLVTPEESGLAKVTARCENCLYFDNPESGCGLYAKLNKTFPEIFNLDSRVSAHGCCNSMVNPNQ